MKKISQWVLSLCVLFILTSQINFLFASTDFSATLKRQIAHFIATKHYLKPRFDAVYAAIHDQQSLNTYLKKLDKYSDYRSKEKIEFAKRRNKERRIGIGVDFLIHAGRILAIPIDNTPLVKSGMKNPDYLTSINNKIIRYNDFDSYRFLGYLRSGEKVILATQGKKYNVRARKINNKTVNYKEVKQYGVLTIRRFTENNVSLIKDALLQAKKMPQIIIDLRHNPGGDLYAATDTLSFFLRKNKNIAYLKNSNGVIDLQSFQGRIIKNKRIIILTSQFTASTAEIFIRALKYYYPKIKTVGEATTGKCLAQENFSLKNGALLHLSVYKVLMPNRQSCQDAPIQPDFIMKNIELMPIKNIVDKL